MRDLMRERAILASLDQKSDYYKIENVAFSPTQVSIIYRYTFFLVRVSKHVTPKKIPEKTIDLSD